MTREEAAAFVATLTPRQIADIAEGRWRAGDGQAEELLIWNAAIDRENGYV